MQLQLRQHLHRQPLLLAATQEVRVAKLAAAVLVVAEAAVDSADVVVAEAAVDLVVAADVRATCRLNPTTKKRTSKSRASRA